MSASCSPPLPRGGEHLAAIRSRPEVDQTQIDPRLLDPAELDKRIESIERDLVAWREGYDQLAGELATATDPEAEAKGLRRLSSLLLEPVDPPGAGAARRRWTSRRRS